MKHLILLSLYFLLTSPPASEIHLTITNIPHDEGVVRLLIFNSPSGFPDSPERAFKALRLPIENGKAEITLKELPLGSYAISAFHDHDGDGIMRKGMFGIPKDPYGFSNDARGAFGPPSFEKSAFILGNTSKKVSFSLKL